MRANMQAGPSVAGVIAPRNQRAFISEAILGLMGKVEELVVVDDASTDGTFEQVAHFSGPRCTVFRHAEQKGTSGSFSDAVLATTSEITVIQGGDDRSLAGRVDRQVEALMDSEIILCASVPRITSETGKLLHNWAAPEFFERIPERRDFEYLFFGSNFICAPSVALRKVDYLQAGIFHPGLDHLQDYFLWMKLAERGRFAVLDNPVIEHRNHRNNLSRPNVQIDTAEAPRQRAE